MSKTYRPYEPNQMFLLPPSLQDWLPPDHMVHVVGDVIDAMDLSPITSVYEAEARGYPPYHPKVMVGILLYGYCHGITSSRKLARHCQEDIGFRVLAANNQPDFRTISEFRRRHISVLHHLFVEILRLCQKAGLVKFGHVSLDGTKIKANASKHKAMSYGRMKQEIARLEQEIVTLLDEAECTDAREDQQYGSDKRGDELPAELVRRETRLAKIRAAKQALEEEAKQEQESPLSKPQAKIKTTTDAAAGTTCVADKAQRNFTDPESRIMPYQKTFVQGYNAQLAVDSAHQIIVATCLTNCPTDHEMMPYMVELLPTKPKVLTADAGYPVDSNPELLAQNTIDMYIAVSRERCGRQGAGTAPQGRPPYDLTADERMARKLRTKKGKRIYARRKAIVEPPIGQIKHVMGFRQFNLRGQFKAEGEWFLVTAAYNLRKLVAAIWRKPKRGLALAT